MAKKNNNNDDKNNQKNNNEENNKNDKNNKKRKNIEETINKKNKKNKKDEDNVDNNTDDNKSEDKNKKSEKAENKKIDEVENKKNEQDNEEEKKEDNEEEKEDNEEEKKDKKKAIILLIDTNFMDNDENNPYNDPNYDPFYNIFNNPDYDPNEDDPEYNPEDDPEYDPEDDPEYDPYTDHNKDNHDNCDDDNCNNKNGKRKNKTIDNIFKNIINSINKKDTKKRKIDPVDDFKEYFKESNTLLPINREIKTLKDLIELGKTFDPKDKNRYVINLRALHKCVKPLEALDTMIGMKNIKEMIVDLIFFRLQNLEDKKEELWHLVIQGTPGSGKTEVAKIIGKIYYSLGITKKDKFTLVKRSDLIGKYLGHTAKLTQEVFDNAKGGILFIDEAYSLGNPEQRDSFSKECIDTINQNLTENKETVVFIAGYKDQLNESFFSYNPGLNRRFKMRLTVDKYDPSDLREIFIKKIKENEWSIMDNNLDKELPLKFFEKNINLFKYNGGDMENLWHLTKIVHSRRIFGKDHSLMKNITLEDLENALKLYCENDEVKNRESEIMEKYLLNTMYC
jgi:hypothetical protein